jgi:hypothetical protein
MLGRVSVMKVKAAKTSGVVIPKATARAELQIDVVVGFDGGFSVHQAETARHTQMHNKGANGGGNKEIFCASTDMRDLLADQTLGHLRRPAQVFISNHYRCYGCSNDKGLYAPLGCLNLGEFRHAPYLILPSL